MTRTLSELGGEFAFIKRIARPTRSAAVEVGIGDDCAVVRLSENLLHLYTTDMLVEGTHFSRSYFTPEEIGVKAMESNVSDVAAMGGQPLYALISLALPRGVSGSFLERFYHGLYEVVDRYGFDLLGGDTTRGEGLVVNVTLIGATTPENLRLRSMAEPGDLIVTSGPLGGSAAGLRLLQAGIMGHDQVKQYHTRPRCALDRAAQIIPLAKAMEDVSDGLASEVRNICDASGVGARLDPGAIALREGIETSAALLGDDPLEYALYGGEDYELVYTVDPARRDQVVGSIVGEITAERELFLGQDRLRKFGYDHFLP